jgi:viologen exporter family transport system permease protein
MTTLRFLVALLGLNLDAMRARPRWALASIAMMFGNNVVFYLVWVIYFGAFSSLGGWRQPDIALLFGLFAWAFGLVSFLSGGVRMIAQTIVDGGLDLHLGRPCHPLPTLLLARCEPSGIGDLASALVFWLWLGERSLAELPLIVLMASAAAVVLCATVVIIQCLVFWVPTAIALCEELFNTLLLVTFYPQHPFGLTVRIVLFTIFPSAFMAFFPAEVIRHPDAGGVLLMLAAAAVYSLLAVLVFDRGLRRYRSGNRLLELR